LRELIFANQRFVGNFARTNFLESEVVKFGQNPGKLIHLG